MKRSLSPAPRLLLRARLRLATLSLLVMGSLLYGAGFSMARLLLQSQKAAINSELQTLAGTLHDSLKPALPHEARPSALLASVLPGLCLASKPCAPSADLMDRHAISATNSDRFKLRVLDRRGALIASSPGPLPSEQASGRWATHTIHLHHSHGPREPTWGYLQISRSLVDLDAEAERLWWLGHGIFALAMLAMAIASWWLAGLAMAPLLEAYRRQEQFSSDVAHELRTPLANLLAVVEAEQGAAAQTNPSATSSLNRVLVQGQRLQRLIADLLLLASLEQPACMEALTPCRLTECLDDLIEDFSETAQAQGVKLSLGISDQNAMVRGRESELSRLLANLLSNAIQHSPRGSVVRVELERQGADINVTVTDQGPGIAEQEQHRIFERFYRADASRSRHSGGTGLGLAIAQAIARRHSGRLTLQSNPGAGCCFRLLLPGAAV